MKDSIKIYCDGGSRGNPGPAASAFVAYKEKKLLKKASKFVGVKTNNYAEYVALGMSVKWFVESKYNQKDTTTTIYMDSELVVNQTNGKYKIKSKHLIPLANKLKDYLKQSKNKITLKSVKREKNKLADKLVNEQLDKHLN